MEASKIQQSLRTFRIIALLGSLLFVIGFVLRWMGNTTTPAFAMALAGAVGLFIGLIGLVILRFTKSE